MDIGTLLAVTGGVPPEIAGIPTWVLNGLSIGMLVAMFFVGLMTDKIWTKGQVNRLIEQQNEFNQQQRERWEKHLDRTASLLKDQAATAERREGEWRTIALDWQKVATMLGDAVDPIHAQSATILEIVRNMQATQQAAQSRRPGR